jgi:hypothetical protein
VIPLKGKRKRHLPIYLNRLCVMSWKEACKKKHVISKLSFPNTLPKHSPGRVLKVKSSSPSIWRRGLAHPPSLPLSFILQDDFFSSSSSQ